MKLRRWTVIALLVGLEVALSLWSRPGRSPQAGAPWLQDARIDPPVLAMIQRSCGDCHSEDTYYPWYSYVVPVEWLINSDVNGGRRHLNFSHWQALPLARKERSLSEIANQVKDGDMPLVQYTLIHRGARLSGSETTAIFQWTQQERARLIAEGRQ